MRIRLLISRVAPLSLVCGLFLGGCGANDDDPSTTEVKEFGAYRVYFAGEQVVGLPLEETEKGTWEGGGRSTVWAFYYGDCDASGGLFEEGGCALPLQIQNYSICGRWPSRFPSPISTFNFRGTKASWKRGRGFEVFTGSTTVVISGTRGSVVKAAARQLRGVRQMDRTALLPPPAPGSLTGKLPCQGAAALNSANR